MLFEFLPSLAKVLWTKEQIKEKYDSEKDEDSRHLDWLTFHPNIMSMEDESTFKDWNCKDLHGYVVNARILNSNWLKKME